jgi:hypothetical protein
MKEEAFAHEEGEQRQNGDTGIMHIGIVIVVKTITRLHGGCHRAPHPSVRAYHTAPTVVLKWTLSQRRLRYHWLIVIFVH